MQARQLAEHRRPALQVDRPAARAVQRGPEEHRVHQSVVAGREVGGRLPRARRTPVAERPGLQLQPVRVRRPADEACRERVVRSARGTTPRPRAPPPAAPGRPSRRPGSPTSTGDRVRDHQASPSSQPRAVGVGDQVEVLLQRRRHPQASPAAPMSVRRVTRPARYRPGRRRTRRCPTAPVPGTAVRPDRPSRVHGLDPSRSRRCSHCHTHDPNQRLTDLGSFGARQR